ncbi:unnamed protein product [Lepidochelys olivacea]
MSPKSHPLAEIKVALGEGCRGRKGDCPGCLKAICVGGSLTERERPGWTPPRWWGSQMEKVVTICSKISLPVSSPPHCSAKSHSLPHTVSAGHHGDRTTPWSDSAGTVPGPPAARSPLGPSGGRRASQLVPGEAAQVSKAFAPVSTPGQPLPAVNALVYSQVLTLCKVLSADTQWSGCSLVFVR